MIKPSIGRVVWFQPSKRDEDPFLPQPLSAQIAYVHSDICINIGYLDSLGVAHAACSVRLVQEGEAVPSSGYFAEWMPYQHGQAKRDAQPAAESPSAAAPLTLAQRLVVECGELSEKTSKLAAFIGTPTYLALTQEQQTRLSHQLNIMRQYLAILNERIAELATNEAQS